MIKPGACVVVNLHSPKEQFWGVLEELSSVGVTLKAININSFEDWARQVARKEEISIGLVTTFFPIHRVEKIFEDRSVGLLKSYARQFHDLVGMAVDEYLNAENEPGGYSH